MLNQFLWLLEPYKPYKPYKPYRPKKSVSGLTLFFFNDIRPSMKNVQTKNGWWRRKL